MQDARGIAHFSIGMQMRQARSFSSSLEPGIDATKA
jgi:hypothetical protein